MMQKSLVIFIDASNLSGGTARYAEKIKDPNYDIDILKMLRRLSRGYELVRTYFYSSTAQPQDIRSKTEQFWHQKMLAAHAQLMHHGVKVTNKLRQKNKEKGVDVALVTDFLMLGMRGAFDVAIIVSGDQDYVNAIEAVQSMGKVVIVACFENSFPDEMYRHVDRYIRLDEFAKEIAKT
jgi:uncharacterized LabA/DUF88 family protein